MALPRPPKLTKRDIKKQFWLTIECEYVEHGMGPTDLAKKYQVSRRSIVRHARDEGWKQKREDFRDVQTSLEKRRERERSETYHERNQLMASSIQARAYRLFLEEQEKLALKDDDKEKFRDTFEGLRERAAIVQSFAVTGQAVGYGPPEPPPPPRTDFKVIIHGTQISSRKFDPDEEAVDIEMEQEGGSFVPSLGDLDGET